MEIRAYSEIYLNKAQNNLKHAADFAITSLNLNPDVFGNAFALSSVSKQFGCGNPHVCCQDKRMRKANLDTQLKTRRINNRLSQSELASSSGVALRQIQLFYSIREISTMPLLSLILPPTSGLRHDFPMGTKIIYDYLCMHCEKCAKKRGNHFDCPAIFYALFNFKDFCP